MTVRIAINGFGRIGRALFRLACTKYPEIQIVAINDLVPADNLAYLLKHDSVHGKFDLEVRLKDDEMIVGDHTVKMLAKREIQELPWKECSVDYVVESTGTCLERANGAKHLEAGAKRVILSAPAKDDTKTLVMGVNHEAFDPQKDFMISNASCTTNCLAPLTKILLENFGIEEGLMTTVHALTPNQPIHDGPSKKDIRGSRSGFLNIIPASTGAAKAVSLCLPEVKGKLTGMAFRVPTADVSVVDLTVKLTKSTHYDTICEVMQEAANTTLKGILGFTDEEVVSTDFIGDTHSSIFDSRAGIGLNNHFFKLISWYDNEFGYACRLLDLIKYMASRDRSIR